jgi:beta-glucosidase/6-phospho-beta-glucosidase/beta-galactosidase
LFPGFVFATGIENSYPTIADQVRVDEMEKCGHYRRWREDLALTHDLSIRHLRWGPALYRVWQGPARYDWEWVDDVVAEMQRLGIAPILDLCHFGVPDWLGNFQNPEFPEYFAEYAAAFARRYSHIIYWTPVNEILITALFSAKYGWWNERLTTEESFVRATVNLCRATILAMRAIRKQIPGAIFVQSESCEYVHPSTAAQIPEADFLNERRFLPLDLIYGVTLSERMRNYLWDHGIAKKEWNFFQKTRTPAGCVLGTDYYVTNEHVLHANGTTGPSGELFGYYVIAKQYYERYRLPLMHTETNLQESSGAVQWLKKQWHSLMQLLRDGIPIHGFTWFSLTDQKDWDTALREDAQRVNAVGLFDLKRKIRPAGQEYRRIIQHWQQHADALVAHATQSQRIGSLAA